MTASIVARLKLARDDFTLDVDLQLPGRGVSALFGHSGSGKTTCLRCLAGLERADKAYIEVNGEVWQDSSREYFMPPHQRPIGYVFQEASLFPHLSVRANLTFGWRRIPSAQRQVGLMAQLGTQGRQVRLKAGAAPPVILQPVSPPCGLTVQPPP